MLGKSSTAELHTQPEFLGLRNLRIGKDLISVSWLLQLGCSLRVSPKVHKVGFWYGDIEVVKPLGGGP